jgi:SAM-dependent methyltransferase
MRFDLADNSGPDELRARLYGVYTTAQAGHPDPESQVPGFKRDIQPRLPTDRGARILDIGCGQGQYVRQLLALGYENTQGIDISPEQVQKARDSGLTQVSLGDYRQSLGVADLDLVIATDFLEHLTKAEALNALDRIKRALRAKGAVVLRVPNAVSPFAGAVRYADFTHELAFTPQSLRQLGVVAGFATVDIYACPPPVHGVMSAVRAGIWWVLDLAMKAALAAETGQLRGHVVTQNVVAVMRLNDRIDHRTT